MSTRREREIERTRRDIVQAAARAFARRGYNATTVQAIAEEAGYTAASLYTYFDSKQRIFDAILELLSADLLMTFDQVVPPGLTFAQELELLLRKQLEIAEQRRDSFAVFLAPRDEGREAPPGQAGVRRGFELYCGSLAAWFADHASADDLGRTPPEDAAHLLVGIGYAFFRRWLHEGSATGLADLTGKMLAFFCHGVRGDGRSVGDDRG